MALDLLIRGGSIVDGSGRARFTGDIGVADGRIVSIGKVTDSARRTINADGLTVSPGFIDGHTHMDAQVMWDPLGSCSCYHGVTTVVMSNCGFTLSPCRPADRKWYAECLSYVEDISTDAMSAGIDWTWETFPEYMAAVAKRPKALNHGMYIGHSGVRMYVMGRRALTDVASDDEVAQMKKIVQQGLRAGAIGFSSSRSHTHLTPGGTPVASRIGEWSEIERIVGGMGELNAGIFQVGPVLTSRTENQQFLVQMKKLALETRRPVMFGVIASRQGENPVQWQDQTEVIAAINAEGGRAFGQASTRSINAIFSLKSYLPFDVLPAWKAVRSLPLSEQKTKLRDPALRRELVAAESMMKPKDKLLQGGGSATTDPRKPDYSNLLVLRNVDWQDVTVAELAQASGKHPVEVMLDLALENENQIFVQPIVNEDRAQLRQVLKRDDVLATFSDSGAHVAQEMGSLLQTHMLNYWVNRTGEFTLEAAVKKMTHDMAQAFEIGDRGLIKEGYKADLVLFEADRIRPAMPTIESDLPGGARRLVLKAEGIGAMVVNGAVTMERGEHTGAVAGQMVMGSGVRA